VVVVFMILSRVVDAGENHACRDACWTAPVR
jgi:hypothetical protein